MIVRNIFSKPVRIVRDFTVRKDVSGVILNPKVISRTKQSFKKEADVNYIIARGRKRGFLTDPSRVSNREAMFGDYSNAEDYLSTNVKIARFNEQFDSLPAVMRNQFHNKPSELIEFLANPENDEEAIEMGLKPKPVIKKEDNPPPVPKPEPAKAPPAPAVVPEPAGTE